MSSKAVIIVSFGTANLDGLNFLEKFEEEVRSSLSEKYYVCKAFTSSAIANVLLNKYGKIVPRLEEVLFSLGNEGYKEVYIRPLHIIEGSEFLSVKNVIKEYNYSFSKINLGKPIMGKDEKTLIEGCNLIANSIEKNLEKNKSIVLVGHGSKTIDTESYDRLKDTFNKKGFKSVYMGTLEGKIRKEDILKKLLKDNIKEVLISPVLMLPGNHIKKDILGDKNSWKALFEENNIKVNYTSKSLIEYDEIRKFYIDKIKS
ncbi:sirohydrochlorin cobaltochelatase [Clostridium sp. Sa3CUN1]|uniref:Sirohydrochlorin cobaltochelatase n=1 Tax=Clostridium gallinarum TaxID=2762246 RepID=A0ABR8Q3J1_9CLOT|nr:sirohydrochlorin cobaltochelatase [Clostridium gallinarum]MBD7914904.1 sirohydrochlorin cobaltochelatase [Clostridium gallinarum]